jgi:hypothetical protein
VDALSGGRKVFCALPQCLSSEEMVAHGRTFADACVEARVTHVVRISSFGERIDVIRALRSNEYVPTALSIHAGLGASHTRAPVSLDTPLELNRDSECYEGSNYTACRI